MSDATVCDICDKKIQVSKAPYDAYWMMQLSHSNEKEELTRKPMMHICPECMQSGIAVKNGEIPKT